MSENELRNVKRLILENSDGKELTWLVDDTDKLAAVPAEFPVCPECGVRHGGRTDI